jgi:hypothetical protein
MLAQLMQDMQVGESLSSCEIRARKLKFLECWGKEKREFSISSKSLWLEKKIRCGSLECCGMKSELQISFYPFVANSYFDVVHFLPIRVVHSCIIVCTK